MTATHRAKLEIAERVTEDLVRSVDSSTNPRALRKLHTALENIRAAFILLNEGEQASVGHSDDPR